MGVSANRVSSLLLGNVGLRDPANGGVRSGASTHGAHVERCRTTTMANDDHRGPFTCITASYGRVNRQPSSPGRRTSQNPHILQLPKWSGQHRAIRGAHGRDVLSNVAESFTSGVVWCRGLIEGLIIQQRQYDIPHVHSLLAGNLERPQ